MCLILFAVRAHPEYKLLLAANRDEFYERPTAPPAFWDDAPHLLAGRDLKGGGTWFGITRRGRIAAITNYRDPASMKENAPSRGELVSRFLLGEKRPLLFLEEVRRDADRYNGFNLLVGMKDELYWTSNRSDQIMRIPDGVHGISNHLLDTPWPKIAKGKQELARLLGRPDGPTTDELLDLLKDGTPAADETLPQTGVPLEWERILSSIFITSPTYGTRSSTLLLIDREDRVTFVDRTFNGHSEPVAATKFEFVLET